jgi:hypothetical protein
MQNAYRRSAIAYAVYGALYMGGAVAALDAERKATFFGFVPWWAFYVAGALVLAVLPVLVWRQFKWVARLLCLGPAVKALVLFWRMGLSLQAGEGLSGFQLLFALAAVVAASLLALAGWGPQIEEAPRP